MTGRRAGPLLVVVLALAGLVAPAAAGAQGAGELETLFTGVEDGDIVRETLLNVRVRGAVVVEYGGDAARGCAAAGTCGTSGRVVWRPGERGLMLLVEYVVRGRRQSFGLLGLGGPFGPAGTVAQVRRATPAGVATCSDAHRPFTMASLVPAGPGRLRLDVAGFGPHDLFATRCGGPLSADLGPALRSPRLPLAELRRGNRTLDLTSDRPLAAGSFSGAVRSTLRLRLGRPVIQPASDGPPVRRVRVRTVNVEYRVERVSGSAAVEFRGRAGGARCEPLDACGVVGRIDLVPRATTGVLVLQASAPAAVPSARVRAALGLGPGRPDSAVDWLAYGGWRGPGRATASLLRPDGGFCRESHATGAGNLEVSLGAGRVRLAYVPWEEVRARCPAPVPADLHGVGLSGSLPLRAMDRPRVVVRLRRPRTFAGAAHLGTLSGDVTLVLRRTSIDETVALEERP